MSLDPATVTLIAALMLNVPTFILLLANKRKVNSDAYAALSSALRTSGQTIDDLFKQLAEVPELKQQLDDMQDELEDLRLGVGILTTQLLKRNITPEWRPRAAKLEKQPAARRSGFGR